VREREGEKERERAHVTMRGAHLIQVKVSRDSLLCNVHVHKPCMQYLKHTYEYKSGYKEYNTLITIVGWEVKKIIG